MRLIGEDLAGKQGGPILSSSQDKHGSDQEICTADIQRGSRSKRRRGWRSSGPDGNVFSKKPALYYGAQVYRHDSSLSSLTSYVGQHRFVWKGRDSESAARSTSRHVHPPGLGSGRWHACDEIIPIHIRRHLPLRAQAPPIDLAAAIHLSTPSTSMSFRVVSAPTCDRRPGVARMVLT